MRTIDTRMMGTQALAQALERMAFLEVLPFLDTPPVPPRFIFAESCFKGFVTGSVQLAVDLGLACELASNIGLLDHPSEEQCLDAVRELANVTCGLVLPLLMLPDADPIDMNLPQARLGNRAEEWLDWIRRDPIEILEANGYAVAVRLNLDS